MLTALPLLWWALASLAAAVIRALAWAALDLRRARRVVGVGQ